MSDIKKVAELANVSIGTVSNAFKKPDKVSPKTRERILQIAKENNYYPNQLASALVTSKTKIIGLMASYSFSSNRGKAITEFSKRAAECGYIVMLATVNMNLEEEESAIRRFLQYRVDGVVIYGDYSDTMTQHFKALGDNGIPFIVVKRFDESYNNITVDAESAFDEMASQIKRYGHERVCAVVRKFMHDDGSVGIRAKRFESFRRALAKNGIELSDDDLFIVDEDTKAAGHDAVDRILARKDKLIPTVIFCMYDHIAIGVMARLLHRGFHIPADISVIGYGNYEISKYSIISLATVDTMETDILQKAFDMLLARIDNPDTPKEDCVIEHRFILRSSLGPVPGKDQKGQI